MARLTYITAWLGAILLVIATLSLLYINRDSSRIYGPFLSVCLAGIATAFIAVVTVLKPAKIVERFPISIAIEMKTNLPIYISPLDIDKAPIQSAIAVRANQEEVQPGHVQPRNIKFETEQDKTAFYLQLLQYEFIKQCFGIFRYDGEITVTTDRIVRARAFDDFNPKEFPKLAGSEISKMLSANMFLDRREKVFWDEKGSWLPIPTKAVLSFPDSRTIVFERPSYFRIYVNIEPFAGGPGAPPHLSKFANGKNVETSTFIVRLQADFYRLTSESPETAEAKRWVEYLFPRLKDTMGDPIL